ncbi:hypothetical protein [Pseudooceanicola marinus]|nr:hypothetical protein [Pseudooceanicola marinus]
MFNIYAQSLLTATRLERRSAPPVAETRLPRLRAPRDARRND